MIKLDKKTGINLKKGSSITLEKKGIPLKKVCIGLNWGAIERAPLLRAFLGNKTVDLDGSVALFSNGKCVDSVNYSKLLSKDHSIRHSGDDTTGDMSGDDGLDNEVITTDLQKMSLKIDTVFFFLNSYKQQDFADIPFSKIRIYEGSPKRVKEVLATFNLSAEPLYKGHVSMVMAKLTRETSGSWKFHTLGEPLKAKDIRSSITEISERFL